MGGGGVEHASCEVPQEPARDPYLHVIVREIRLQQLEDIKIAAALQVDRTHFGRVRRGKRPLLPALREQLIDYLKIDRTRLAFAVAVMNDPDCYFNLTFQKACFFVETMLVDTMRMIRETGGLDVGIIMASLPRDRCEALARTQVQILRDRFTALDPLPPTLRAA